MRNIIKALHYQTRTDNVTYYSILLMLFFAAMTFIDSNITKTTGSEYIAHSGESLSLMPTFALLMLSIRICGWDYSDKTMNYEIMSGHHRKEVYFGRVIVSLAWCVTLCFVFMVLPTLIFTLVNGWGVTMDLGGMAIRYLLVLLPMIRIVCQCIMLTFLVKSAYVAWAAGFVITMVVSMFTMIAEVLTEIKLTWHTATTNLMKLFTFNQKMGYVNGEDVTICETALDPSFVIGTIAVSLTVSVICIVLGYLFFKKSDVN
ncbi:MAG: ABC transporter permease subunit [Oscillospiraceae bacterium]|nr:ABC transporter permease subunit [Oscillospiraceae bacterium]